MAIVHASSSDNKFIGRKDNRSVDELRPIRVVYEPFGYAAASVLLEQGHTKVLVSVSLQTQVPPFLKGKHKGWLTAEYAVLPCATRQRSNRDAGLHTKNSRGVEISRLIGRSLRAVVDVSLIGERTIQVDCDVLQADGGTRTACITAASLALNRASERWLETGVISRSIIRDSLAAVSIGALEGIVYTDLTQEEDNRADADFNFVITRAGAVVEVQGTAETRPMSRLLFEELQKRAFDSAAQLFEALDCLHQGPVLSQKQVIPPAPFSLASRFAR